MTRICFEDCITGIIWDEARMNTRTVSPLTRVHRKGGGQSFRPNEGSSRPRLQVSHGLGGDEDWGRDGKGVRYWTGPSQKL